MCFPWHGLTHFKREVYMCWYSRCKGRLRRVRPNSQSAHIGSQLCQCTDGKCLVVFSLDTSRTTWALSYSHQTFKNTSQMKNASLLGISTLWKTPFLIELRVHKVVLLDRISGMKQLSFCSSQICSGISILEKDRILLILSLTKCNLELTELTVAKMHSFYWQLQSHLDTFHHLRSHCWRRVCNKGN
jgi:hypothetical protein